MEKLVSRHSHKVKFVGAEPTTATTYIYIQLLSLIFRPTMGNHFTDIDEKMPAAGMAVGRFYATLIYKFGYNNLIYKGSYSKTYIGGLTTLDD